jgi:hypothetical protein
MMDEVEKSKKAKLKGKIAAIANWNFRPVYFFDNETRPTDQDDIPAHLHMLQHVHRSAKYQMPGNYAKVFHDTTKPLTLHNHFPFACLTGKCPSFYVPIHIAHIQHYRAGCVAEQRKKCDSEFKNVSVRDTTIWRWKDQVIQGTSGTLQELGLIPPPDLSEC